LDVHARSVEKLVGPICVRFATASLLLALVLPPFAHANQPEPEPAVAAIAPRTRSSGRPIQELAVSPDQLGANWILMAGSIQELDDEHLGRLPRSSDPLALFQVGYRNEADYDPARETSFLVAEFEDQQQATLALRDYLAAFTMGNRRPEVRWRWPPEEVKAGDQGVRFGYAVDQAFTAGYLFRIDTYIAGVLMRGAETDEEDLLGQATTVTGWQEGMLATAL
jgi:hypothetical protein